MALVKLPLADWEETCWDNNRICDFVVVMVVDTFLSTDSTFLFIQWLIICFFLGATDSITLYITVRSILTSIVEMSNPTLWICASSRNLQAFDYSQSLSLSRQYHAGRIQFAGSLGAPWWLLVAPLLASYSQSQYGAIYPWSTTISARLTSLN